MPDDDVYEMGVNLEPLERDIRDGTAKVQELDSLLNKVQQKGELTYQQTVNIARHGLGLISTIASATGTSVGQSLSMVISGAISSYQLLQSVATSQLSNPYTAIFGALTMAQITFLWTSIIQAVTQKEQISSGFAAITSSLTTLIGTVSYR